MDVKLVKAFLGKTVYYDTGQINFEGCRRGGRAAKTRTNFKRRQKGYFLAFFCVRILDATSRCSSGVGRSNLQKIGIYRST